ncbi:MAG: hypothetical protein HYR76_03715 [Ignavibacteria bacterium]|nr:hypothetical protein [Ignavibacteria bacterium]MBI3765872.1 hypothetical protein [Ignavibacteriales bacterium]
MPSKEYYHALIDRELLRAREALKVGNEGKARVCARRAAGHALAWFLSIHPNDAWGKDAMNQLTHLKDDTTFPPEVRDAAVRLTTKISERFAYPFTSDPIADTQIIITCVEHLMESHDR